MKKTLALSLLLLILLFGSTSFIFKSSSGIAGRTGSPGEQTCAGGGCHSGGTFSTFSVAISANPSFSLNQFVPGTIYTLSIDVSAMGCTKFGFGCEILNSLNANAGTMQAAGPGVKFLTAGNSRRNAVQTTPKTASGIANFTFEWVAPLTDTSATIYVCGNAVNGNGSTSGDKPIPASLYLTAFNDPTSHVGIKETPSAIGQVMVFPNPAKDFLNVSIELKQSQSLDLILLDLNGRLIKTLFQGEQAAGKYSKILDVQDIPSGVYFLRINGEGKKLSQKLLLIE